MRIWGGTRALPAPPRDPMTNPARRFAPRGRRWDLVSGPEELQHAKRASIQGSRCPFAPITPLSPQEIPPIVQSGPWPPPSPSPCEPCLGSLAPVCGGAWQGQESTESSRAAACAAAPVRRDNLVAQGPLGGALRGRLMLSDRMVAQGSFPAKNAASAWPWGRLLVRTCRILCSMMLLKVSRSDF